MTILERNQRLHDRQRFLSMSVRLHRRSHNNNPVVIRQTLSSSTSITTINPSRNNLKRTTSSSSSSMQKLFWKFQRSNDRHHQYSNDHRHHHFRYGRRRRSSSIGMSNYSRMNRSSILRKNGSKNHHHAIDSQNDDTNDDDHHHQYHHHDRNNDDTTTGWVLPVKLIIDQTTYTMIQLEIQNILIHNTTNHIITLPIAIVNALVGSRNVLNSYANDDDADDDAENDISSFSSSLPSLSLQRRYDLIHVLNDLQIQVASSHHPKPIVSLDDAINLLSNIFQFPSNCYHYDHNKNNTNESSMNLLQFTNDLSMNGNNNNNNIDSSNTNTELSVPIQQTYSKNNVEHFIQRLRDIRIEEMTLSSSSFIVPYQSQQKWLDIANTTLSKLQIDDENEIDEKDEIHKVKPLFRELTNDEKERIQDTITIDPSIGHNKTDIIVRTEDDTDSVQRMNLCTLLPYEWLNDEVIHYFLYLLQKRDEIVCNNDDSIRKRTHFFKSFFMTKLLNEGNHDPNLDGIYTYNNVKRWSKKVPGMYFLIYIVLFSLSFFTKPSYFYLLL
jgi:hypothetical protein